MGEVHCILFFRTTKIKYLQLDKSFRKHCRTHSPPPNFTQVHDMHPPPPPTHTHTHTHPLIDYQNLSIAIGDGKRVEASFYE